MEDKLFGNFTLLDILVELFVAFVMYVLATFISVFVRRNKEFMTPVIFALIYGNYISFGYMLSK